MPQIHQESATEFFREQVEQAIAHQRVRSSQSTAYYLVQLLNSFVCPERYYQQFGVGADQSPLEILCQALTVHGQRQLQLLRLVGDLSLFMTGFQSDHLQRRQLGLNHYIQVGGYAYATVASSGNWRIHAEVFDELARHFTAFVDVLSEVSEHCSLTDNAQLLNLYERWLHTGSDRTAALLRRQGIMLTPQAPQVQ